MKNQSNIKAKYLRTLQEYVDERLYITDRTDELKKELDSNCWHINGSLEEIQSLGRDEWTAYIRHLINDRQNQLNASPIQTDLKIYFWHDEMAGQLRFNVITTNHPDLPFGCKYVEAGLDEILDPFINDENPGMIPFTDLIIDGEGSTLDLGANLEDEKNVFILKVYMEKLKKINQMPNRV